MKDLLITKNQQVFQKCVELDLICSIDLGFSLNIEELKFELPNLPITNMPTKKSVTYDFDSGIEVLHNKEKQYSKDIPTPPALLDKLNQHIPEICRYNGKWDLQRELPADLKAISCMTYIGDNNSGTPFHMDQGGSPGHNCLCYAESGAHAIWYLIDRSNDAIVARNMTNFSNENTMRTIEEISAVEGDIQIEKSFAFDVSLEQFESNMLNNNIEFINSYKKYLASNVITFKQTQGIFIFIPNGTMHQVHNFGLSAKIAWNITTPSSCAFFFNKLQPIYALQKRPQVYRHLACLMYFLYNFVYQYNEDTAKYTTELTIHAFNQLSIAMTTFEEALFQLWMPLDLMKFNKCKDPVDQTLDIVCDKCRADVFLFCFHCNCPNGEVLKSLHQSISVKHTEGHDYCVKCFGSMSEKDRHCNNVELQELQPSGRMFKEFTRACGYFNTLRQDNKFKDLRVLPMSPRHQLFEDDADYQFHKINKRNGYEAFRIFQTITKKRRSSVIETPVASKKKLKTVLPTFEKEKETEKPVSPRTQAFIDEVRADDPNVKIGYMDRTSSPIPSSITICKLEAAFDEDGDDEVEAEGDILDDDEIADLETDEDSSDLEINEYDE